MDYTLTATICEHGQPRSDVQMHDYDTQGTTNIPFPEYLACSLGFDGLVMC